MMFWQAQIEAFTGWQKGHVLLRDHLVKGASKTGADL
jgi:hypothetical protein